MESFVHHDSHAAGSMVNLDEMLELNFSFLFISSVEIPVAENSTTLTTSYRTSVGKQFEYRAESLEFARF